MGQIFTISGGKMVPIDNSDLIIGLKVVQAHNGDTAVIVEIKNDGACIVFEDGKMSFGQRLESRSPFTRITAVEPRVVVDQIEVARLKDYAERTRIQARLDRDEARRLHNESVETFKGQFEAEHSDRYTIGSSHSRGARNLKRQLQKAFPGVAFKVTSKSYSGGDSIDVSWSDGPTTASVDAIAQRYREGDFNGMEDLYESSDVPERQAFNAVMGSAKYVFSHRSYNNLTREAVVNLIKNRYDIPAEASTHSTMIKELGEYLDHHVNGLLSETTIPTGGMLTGLSYETGDCVLIFTVPRLQAAGQLNVQGVNQ